MSEYPKPTGNLHIAPSSGAVAGFISSKQGQEYFLSEREIYQSINHYEGDPREEMYKYVFMAIRAYNIEKGIKPLYPHITYTTEPETLLPDNTPA